MTDNDGDPDFETALALGVALTGAWVAYAVVSAAVLAYWMLGVQLAAAALTFGVWLWAGRTRPRVDTLVHYLCGASALGLTVLAMISGQSESHAWWQLLLLPIVAATLLGSRGFIAWLLPVAALVGLVHLSDALWHFAPPAVAGTGARSLAGVILTALALIYVIYTRDAARRQLRTVTERERTIATQADELSRAYAAIADARDHAIRALRGKTEFLATLSHELRSPLNGLLGLSSVLLESKLSPQHTELVRTLNQSASSMRKILNDVLDLSRIESGRIDLNEDSVDLRELIGEVLDVFAPKAAGKGVELAGIVPPHFPQRVRLDAIRFGQVVTNLVNNALKFTERGEIVVSVEQRDALLRLSVRDSGPGIAPEERDKLFRPFEQTASGEKSREIGSGLGLWISQRIVEAMGGKLGVTSDLGKGSCFFVEWEARIEQGIGRESVEIRRGTRMLAVEDHDASARALSAIAEELGIDLRVARSLSDAMRLTQDVWEPQIALIDATMPGATPLAAAEALRAIPTVRVIPLVQAIAPTAEQIRVGIQPPFVATTLKPYRASRLQALLSEVLAPRPAMPTPITLSPWRPLSVLVVDDDSTNRLVASLLLERAGLRPRASASGEEALKLLASEQFDVVLLDLHMQGIDGLETARRIRKQVDPANRLWVVALTASVYEEDRQRCIEAGMDDFIAKPIEIGLFRAALERAQRAVRRRMGIASSTTIQAIDGGIDARTFDKLYRALGRDPQEIALLIDDYVRSSADLCTELRDAISQKSVSRAQRAAHTLASSSGQLGAYRLERLARTMERETDSGALPEGTAVDALEREREGAVVRLHERLSELTTG